MKNPVTDEMVDRFLTWPLPKGFAPDCGISFDGRPADALGYARQWPVGTNLLTAEQARQMLEHVLDLPTPSKPGISDSRCNYVSAADSVCNKCGHVHDGTRTALAEAERLANGELEGSSHPHRDHIDTIRVIVHALATHPANERRETAADSGELLEAMEDVLQGWWGGRIVPLDDASSGYVNATMKRAEQAASNIRRRETAEPAALDLKAVRAKLVTGLICHPNLTRHLISEALELLDAATPPKETPK